jgi:hypothetical protein
MNLDIQNALNELKKTQAAVQTLIKNARIVVQNDDDDDSIVEPVDEVIDETTEIVEPTDDGEIVEEITETVEPVEETASVGDSVTVAPEDGSEPVTGEIITIIEEPADDSQQVEEPVTDAPPVTNRYQHIKNAKIINGKVYAPVVTKPVQNTRPKRIVMNGVTYQEVVAYDPNTYATVTNTRKVTRRIVRNTRPTNNEIDPNTKAGKAIIDGVVTKLTNEFTALKNTVEAALKQPITTIAPTKNSRTVKNADGTIEVVIDQDDTVSVVKADSTNVYNPTPAIENNRPKSQKRTVKNEDGTIEVVIEPAVTDQTQNEPPIEVSVLVDGKEVATTNNRQTQMATVNNQQEEVVYNEGCQPLAIPSVFGKK